jgi:hypothetical protein
MFNRPNDELHLARKPCTALGAKAVAWLIY